MDALTRRGRMQGFETLWLPGMDHASIAGTPWSSARSRRRANRRDLGREAFVERVWRWKEEHDGGISGQMRRLGDSVDWARERFTIDDGLNRAVQHHLQSASGRRPDLPRRAAGELVTGLRSVLSDARWITATSRASSSR